jgi:hypothetical protein
VKAGCGDASLAAAPSSVLAPRSWPARWTSWPLSKARPLSPRENRELPNKSRVPRFLQCCHSSTYHCHCHCLDVDEPPRLFVNVCECGGRDKSSLSTATRLRVTCIAWLAAQVAFPVSSFVAHAAPAPARPGKSGDLGVPSLKPQLGQPPFASEMGGGGSHEMESMMFKRMLM